MEYLPIIFIFIIAIFLCFLSLFFRKPKSTPKKPTPTRVSEYDNEGYNRQGYNEVGRNRQGKYNRYYNVKSFAIDRKTPRLHFCNRGVVLNIEFYFNIFPFMHTLFGWFGVFILLSILFGERKFCEVKVSRNYLPDFIAACAAARRAIGTRKGEQDT